MRNLLGRVKQWLLPVIGTKLMLSNCLAEVVPSSVRRTAKVEFRNTGWADELSMEWVLGDRRLLAYAESDERDGVSIGVVMVEVGSACVTRAVSTRDEFQLALEWLHAPGT